MWRPSRFLLLCSIVFPLQASEGNTCGTCDEEVPAEDFSLLQVGLQRLRDSGGSADALVDESMEPLQTDIAEAMLIKPETAFAAAEVIATAARTTQTTTVAQAAKAPPAAQAAPTKQASPAAPSENAAQSKSKQSLQQRAATLIQVAHSLWPPAAAAAAASTTSAAWTWMSEHSKYLSQALNLRGILLVSMAVLSLELVALLVLQPATLAKLAMTFHGRLSRKNAAPKDEAFLEKISKMSKPFQESLSRL
eukprot:TRINITY_DN7554_c0_g1_i1.p1 TRINITY_DN7554_c0_g1~~TRINITY_DN7554_c0_g1_i1.p1  ORF type:complete len:250 (-),score=66.69 TRINITY_DN7554_c0_g1_i1:241-990(-)